MTNKDQISFWHGHKFIVSLLCMILCFQLSNASSKAFVFQEPVRGKIISKTDGQPLPGASVLIKGTKTSVTTDAEGNFSINATSGDVLVFFFMGYASQEIIVGNKKFIEVSLIDDTKELEEVVVVGYGTQKRKDLTGSVSTLSKEAYKDQPVVTASAALQGRVAGVVVQNNSGAPGGGVKIRIRGANSVNASNEPLYVVDGVALSGVGLQDFNVNDIESMEILKDASATAVYGSRGANGVVIVTTKRGKTGGVKIDYNTFLSFNKPMKTYELMEANTYAKVANLTAGANVFPNVGTYQTTDWQERIFQDAVTKSHQLSVSGGNEKTKYFVSGFYVDQEGLLINTYQKKYGLRTNLNLALTSKLDLDLNIFITRQNSHNNTDIGSKGNPVMSALTIDRNLEVYDENGNYNRFGLASIWPNPYMLLKERDVTTFNNVGVFNGNLKYRITDGLTFNTSAALNASLAKTAYLNNDWVSPGNTGAGQTYYENYTVQTNNVLTFRKSFDKHDFSVMGAVETTSNVTEGFTAAGTGLATVSNSYYNLGLNNSQSISSLYSNWALLSYIGRLTYGYDDKYLFTGTIRRDGSSKFQGDNKWSTFPSVGIAWKVSNEEFAKEIKSLSNLKLRAGWGITGNQGINPYGTLGLLTPLTYSYGTQTLYPAYTIGNPSNPNLKWETTTQANLGVDLSFFDNRLNITADYYNKDTRDLLLDTRIPNYDGGGTYLRNVGKVNNKGIELSVEGTVISTDNFKWSSSVNYFRNRNKVVSLGGDDLIETSAGAGLFAPIQVIKVGSPLSSFYLIPWEGIHQTQNGIYQPGDAKYTDVSGNGTIGFEDRVVSGSALPKFQYGFNNTFNYKNFSLNVFVQGSYGAKVFNATYAATAIPTSDVRFITLKDASNYWTPTNTSSTWRNPASTNKAWVESTQFLQDGSFARLKNISLSYQLNQGIFKDFSAKVYISAQNLFTITKYKGFDPEATSTSANSDTQSGIDLGAYPSPKTFTIGAQVTF